MIERGFFVCKCPLCEGTIVEQISICYPETSIQEDANKIGTHNLENVTIKTAAADIQLIENIRSALKTSIHDEDVYNRVVTNLQHVFEAYI